MLRLVKVDHKLVHGQEIVEKTFLIDPIEVSVGFMQSSNSGRSLLRIGWEPEKTLINYANIEFTIHGSSPFALPMPSIKAEVLFNGVTVGSGGWSPFNSCTSVTGTVSVLPWLRNFTLTGERDIVELIVSNMFMLSPATSTVRLEGKVTVGFQGKEPVTKPEEQARREELMRMIALGALGFGAIAFLGWVVVPTLKKRP